MLGGEATGTKARHDLIMPVQLAAAKTYPAAARTAGA
jgi:hypothetical protein